MEQITERQAKAQTLRMAHAALGRAINETNKLHATYPQGNPGIDEIICFARIKSFENVIEAFWKFLRTYLREVCHIDPVASPRGVMDQAEKQRIISDNEFELLIEMLDNRNRMSHVYDAASSGNVLDKIPEYHEFLGNLIKRLCQ